MNDAMNRLRALQKQMYALQYAPQPDRLRRPDRGPARGSAGRGEALEVLTARTTP